MMKLNPLLFLIGFLISNIVSAQVFDVPYKDDAPTRTLLISVQKAKAVVLLFPGGGGILRLQGDGSSTNPHTFVRSRNMWAQYGIDSVLVDTPYDLGAGMRNSRSIRDHQQRILNVVRYCKEKLNLPIWIFGHSMGTVSVTEFVNGGIDQSKLISGVIVAGTYRVSLNRFRYQHAGAGHPSCGGWLCIHTFFHLGKYYQKQTQHINIAIHRDGWRHH